MNIKSVSYVLGWILRLESIFMLLPIVCALVYGEAQGFAYAAVAAVCLLISFPLSGVRRRNVVF